MFQSTPGINAGQIVFVISNNNILVEFQSTPGINAGRIASRPSGRGRRVFLRFGANRWALVAAAVRQKQSLEKFL